MIRISKHHFLLSCFLSVSLFSLNVKAEKNDTAVKVDWGYVGNTGPAHWGSLNSDFLLCAEGRYQSPIDITKKVKAGDHPLSINYQAAPMMIVEDGTTELLIGDTQTVINDGHSVQLNFPADGLKEVITLEGKEYRLVELHIHTPSENQWHGQTFPMEIHFVHQGREGKLAVIGVLVKGGEENAVLQKMINHFPATRGKVMTIEGESVNPANLMPSIMSYYTFQGSLTTPPCAEEVQWVVMATPITASPAQIVAFKKAAGGPNARPVQPLNERAVSHSGKAS